MPNNPVSPPLPADLPTNWVYGQTVGPNGTDVGLTQQHGYNYLMQAVNAVQNAANALGQSLAALDADSVGAIPSAEKGKANGVAELDSSGKVPSAQLPAMNYDPAGSAQAVQEALTTHVDDTENPHNVTASQAGAFSKEDTLQTSTAELFGLSGSATPNDVLQKLSEAAFNANGSITDVNGDAIGVQIATGSYSGTGSIQKISLTFKPKFLFIVLVDRTNTSAEPVLSFSTPNAGRYQAYSSSASPINITFEKDGFTLQTKMNERGYTYDYTAIG